MSVVNPTYLFNQQDLRKASICRVRYASLTHPTHYMWGNCVSPVVAGITVDEVFDVMYLNPLEMMPVPAAVHSINDEYLRGTAPERKKNDGSFRYA